MALFKTLKQVKQAMSPDAIRQGLEAGRAELSGARTGMTEEQLAALAPEQRAALEAQQTRNVQAAADAAVVYREMHEREVARRALFGPAGEHVYGPMPSATPQDTSLEDTLAVTKEQFKDVLRNPFGARKPPPPPDAPTGPVDRDRQEAGERAARTAARAPYLATERVSPTFTRIATKSKSQLEEVTAHLGRSGLSARPDLVFGVYRVPDHIGGTILRGGSRVVEWAIVHAATDGLPAADPAVAARFGAAERWVGRRDGERAPLDEDLALAYLDAAGIGPEQCLGIARMLEVTKHGGGEGETSTTVAQVAGVCALHPAGLGSAAYAQLERSRPVAAPPADDVQVVVLNWRAIARAVAPHTHRLRPIPSPFPHLPGTPQELLAAYLEVVGVRPADAYAAQVTEDEPRDLTGVSQKGPMTVSTDRGDEQPCADGEPRRRLTGGSRVVIAYRDRPEYAEGRDRWAAYERDVLDAALAHGTTLRPILVGPGRLDRGAVGKLLRGAERVADLVDMAGDDPWPDIPPYRYCWPLAE